MPVASEEDWKNCLTDQEKNAHVHQMIGQEVEAIIKGGLGQVDPNEKTALVIKKKRKQQ